MANMSMISLQHSSSYWSHRIWRIQWANSKCLCMLYELWTDKMGQYEWGNGLKHWNIEKLSYKLCISFSDRGKCLRAWIIHCLYVSLAFFFCSWKQEKFIRLKLFSSSSRSEIKLICLWLLLVCIHLQVTDSVNGLNMTRDAWSCCVLQVHQLLDFITAHWQPVCALRNESGSCWT